jgi:hypothetical protein
MAKMTMMKAADERVLLFRAFLSLWGAVSLGAFGLIVGLVWGVALDVSLPLAVAAVGILGAVWGAIAFQLTPTGGVIMANKATVNYVVIALHGWFAAIACIVGLIVWGVRLAMQ